MQEVIRDLHRLRARSRWLLLLQRSSALGAWVLGSVLVVGGMDYLLRFPREFRLLLLLGGLGAASWSLLRAILPAWRFRPSLTELALRVERTFPALTGRLASSVEFAIDGSVDTNALAARSAQETRSRLSAVSLSRVTDARRTRRGLITMALIASSLTLIAIVSPASARTGLSRIFWPMGDSAWPARTAIVSLMDAGRPHARGHALALRVRGLQAPGDDLEHMKIFARYRLLLPGGETDRWREVVLRHQSDAVYEQLVDTDAEAIEFSFIAEDSETPRQRILLPPSPEVVSASVEIAPPAYAADRRATAMIELGPGLDERAFTETPALAGSQVALHFVFNKPLPLPSDPDQAEWVRRTFGLAADQSAPQLIASGDAAARLTLRWTLDRTTTLNLHLEDEHGLANVEDIAYRIDAVADAAPAITIIEPEADLSVLATAAVPLASEARDDVGLVGLGLEARRQPISAADPSDPLWQAWEPSGDVLARLAHTLDLAPLGLREGDVVEVFGSAEDGFDLDGNRHPRAHSPVRRLRIISEREFGETLFQELKSLRQNAIRLEGQQAELQADVIDEGVQPGVAGAQERIGERLAEQLESLREVATRSDMNRFEDSTLEALMDQARDLLEHAGRASNAASKAIEDQQRGADAGERSDSPNDEENAGGDGNDATTEQNPLSGDDDPESKAEQGEGADQRAADAAQAEEPEDAEPQEAPSESQRAATEDREIVERQQEVRDELRDLIESLDRNEDTWVMNQRIRDLLDEQTTLQQATQALSNQTMGRSTEELEPEQLSELDRIRQTQEALASRMQEMIDDLRERAESMEEVDPAAAASQRAAADTAEQRETSRKMEQASREVAENQLQNARNSQQQAREDLERMLEDINRKRAQAEELQRRLESLVQSIDRLVTVQEAELSALIRALEDRNYAGRDRAMIRLNQNTQSVGGEARAAGQDASRIARALDRAADAQGEAVGALRASPIAHEGADAAENRSLEQLKEAKALAEELQQQVEEDLVRQKREELMALYRDLAEREVALRETTLELQAGGELDRRTLVEARRQANVQDEIRSALDVMRGQNEEIATAPVFSHVHDLVEDWSNEVIAGLREGDVSAMITDREFSIAGALSRLATALEEEQVGPEEFEDGQEAPNEGGGDQGGESGEQPPQPLVPPLSELKLLRSLQELIYDETRMIDGRTDLEESSRRQRLRELGRNQQTLLDLGQRMLEALESQTDPPERDGSEGVAE